MITMIEQAFSPRKNRSSRVVWATASVLILATSCQPNESPATHRQVDSLPEATYLQNAGAEWDRLFNSRDLAGLAALYADDVISMPFNAPTIHGRTALRADFEQFFAHNKGRHETFVDEILTKDNWAIERARYTLTYAPKGVDTEVVESGRHIVCRKKMNGRWLIAWEIWNTDTPRRATD